MNSVMDEAMPPVRRVLVIGVGNPYRCDDGVGPHLAQAVRKNGPAHAHVIEHSGEGGSLMSLWHPDDAVFLFDAVRSGSLPGSISYVDALSEKLPSDYFHYSSHAFSVAEAIEVSRVLGALPKIMRIYGIEGEDFSSGQRLSLPVSRAVGLLLPRVLRELRQISIATELRAEEGIYA